MFEGADKATISANIKILRGALTCVMAIESNDIEPCLVDSLLEMKQELYDLLGVRPEQHAYYGGSTWP